MHKQHHNCIGIKKKQFTKIYNVKRANMLKYVNMPFKKYIKSNV